MRGSDLASGEIIETDTNWGPGAGELELQTTPPTFGAGSYAFGLVGSSEVMVGTFCSNSNSSLTFLQADTQGALGTSDFSSSGTGGYSTLDSYGRFTTATTPFSLSDGTSADLTFYAVANGKVFAIVTGGNDSVGSPLPPMAGEGTGQPGSACPQQAGSFSNSSLSTSVFNAEGSPATAYSPAEVGLVNNINPSAGTLAVTADLNINGTSSIISDMSAPFSISGAGRGTVTITNSQGQQSQTIFYLDGLGNAYLITELVAGQSYPSFGLATSQGTNAVPVTGTYASGEELIPLAYFISAGFTPLPATQVSLDATAQTLTDETTGGSSGSYMPDTNNPGRYTATLNNTVTFGDTSIVFYVVGANKIVAMGLTSNPPSLVDLLR
jgi:hypothetical protein